MGNNPRKSLITTGLLIDDRFRRHDTGPFHPESPDRLVAIQRGLETGGWIDRCRKIEPIPAARKALERIHTHEYLDRLEAAGASGVRCIDDPECPIGPQSVEIAKLAAGGVIEAAGQIARGELTHAFCAVRPPGHHAEADRAAGFCLLNNVALAAAELRDAYGFERIAIVDWDVHHGNGTQHVFDSDPRVLFVSLHGDPRFLYPGTGYPHERGHGAGKGFTVNVSLPMGCDDAAYQRAFEQNAVRALRSFEPQIVLVSAGFDAHKDDPLGRLALTDSMYDWLTAYVVAIADEFAQGRVLSVLEGGYNLDVLKRCVPLHVARLLDPGDEAHGML